MRKIDLITGFLGAGKTTFLKKYASYLLRRGERIGILENDFGAANVDMMLLQELRGENCELEMVSACCGNDPDAHRRRLKTKLISMGMSGYDRVLLEPSGIFDVDELLDLLYEEPLDRWYELGNVIAVVDARPERNLPAEAEYILAAEIADAGKIVLSRCREASEAEQEETAAQLNRALEGIRCPRRLDLRRDILRKDWDTLTDEDFEALAACGYRGEAFEKRGFEKDGHFDSLLFMNLRLSEKKLREAVHRILADPECGLVFRVKGFVREEKTAQDGEAGSRGCEVGLRGCKAGSRDGEAPADAHVQGGWLQLNATRQEIQIAPIGAGQELLIVIGEGLQKAAIESRLAEAARDGSESGRNRE